jgi:hypothetical protein
VKTKEVEKTDKQGKGGTWPLVVFMVGLIVLMIVLKLAMNYFSR